MATSAIRQVVLVLGIFAVICGLAWQLTSHMSSEETYTISESAVNPQWHREVVILGSQWIEQVSEDGCPDESRNCKYVYEVVRTDLVFTGTINNQPRYLPRSVYDWRYHYEEVVHGSVLRSVTATGADWSPYWPDYELQNTGSVTETGVQAQNAVYSLKLSVGSGREFTWQTRDIDTWLTFENSEVTLTVNRVGKITNIAPINR